MTRTKIFSLGFLLCLMSLQSGLAQSRYKVREDTSRVSFTLRHFANQASGKFKDFSGDLSFSKASPETSSISFSVDAASVDTANSTRDSHLRGQEYFDVASHPKMTFESRAFKKVGKNRFMVTGPLTMRGQSKNITVPVVLQRSQTLWATGEEALQFSCQFSIDRTDFGVGESSSLLGSEVSIDLNLEFRQVP